MTAPVVLLIDDHADTREMYAHMLSASNFDVLGAEDGADGLAQASRHPPSIVVTDLRMPGEVSVTDLCRHFQAIDVPVIVITGVSPGPEHDDARRAGCALLVMKPFGPDELLIEIRRILRLDA